MLTVKHVLDSLKSKEKQLLMYAFEHQLSQYVELENKIFIGVNVSNIKHLSIEQSAGVWSIGKIKEK